jgi:hypothetical protein
MYNKQVLQTVTNRPVLPVAIQSIMPHITLQLCLIPSDSHSSSIHCVLDTAAALCTRNYHFFAAIATFWLEGQITFSTPYLHTLFTTTFYIGIIEINQEKTAKTTLVTPKPPRSHLNTNRPITTIPNMDNHHQFTLPPPPTIRDQCQS